jgi:YD repeat-containing protein
MWWTAWATSPPYSYDGCGNQVKSIFYDTAYATTGDLTMASMATWVAGHTTAADSVTLNGYDTIGNLTSRTLAYGGGTQAATTSFTYNAFGQVRTITDPETSTTTNAYDEAGNLLSVTDSLSHAINYLYNAFGDRVWVQDQRSNAGFFYYDQLGRLTLQIDPEAYATLTTYGFGDEIATVTRQSARSTGAPTTTTPPTLHPSATDDEVTAFARDRLGRLTGITDAGGNSELYGLNAFGDQISVTNKKGGVTTNTYDERGLLSSSTVPGSSAAPAATTNYTYDARGNRTKMVEAAGITGVERATNYAYDLNNRLTSQTGDAVPTVDQNLATVTPNPVPTQSYIYDARGNVIESDDAGGGRTLSYYDLRGDKTAQVDALGALTKWTYDHNGNVQTQTVYGDFLPSLPVTPGGTPPNPVDVNNCRVTTYAYDDNNRLTTTTATANTSGILTGSYNGTSYQTATINIVSQNVYDAAGNVVQTIDGNTNSTYFYYDKLGHRTGQVDPAGFLTVWTLDQNGNVTRETRYATALAAGFSTTTLPTGTTNAANRITNFTYDMNGRRLTESRTGVASNVISATGVMTTGATTATITYTYNELGEVLTKTEATLEQTVYVYDDEGRQIQVSDPSYLDYTSTPTTPVTVTPVTKQYYDALGNVVRTTVNEGGSVVRTTTYTYGKGGRLATSTDAQGFVETYLYDTAGHTVGVKYTRVKSDNTTVVEAVAYRYDLLGRQVYQATATLSGSTWAFGDSSQTQYDSYGEVTGKGANGLWEEKFTYDGAGRVIKSTAGDGTTKFYLSDGAGNQTLTITSNGLDMSGYTLSQALNVLTNTGANLVGAVYVAGANATISCYDARGQATSVIQPQRDLDASGTHQTLTTSKTYNAFGEVSSQTSARGYVTSFVYNTLGKIKQQINPSVSSTDDTGAQSTSTPTLNYYYDLSGRLVGSRDANGFLTRRLLLAGSGYGGEEPDEVAEFHPDGGVVRWGYDVFGDQRTYTNALGRVEKRAFDAMGRLLTVSYPGRADGTRLVDFYAYDGLGQRVSHTNSLLTSGLSEVGFTSAILIGAASSLAREQTDYDAQGRVIREIDYLDHTTTYAYTWNGGLTTGIGTDAVGGWTKTTTIPAGLDSSDTTDYFGRLVSHDDFAATAHTTTYTFDAAGRLTTTANNAGLSITRTYYNTGQLATLADSFDTVTTSHTYTSTLSQAYTYDADGHHLTETYSGSYANPVVGCFSSEPTQTTTSYQNAVATYDSNGRILTITDSGQGATQPVTINYEYDLNGNIRRVNTTYENLLTGTNSTQDYWYKYDSMNRFTLVQGGLTTGARGGGLSRMLQGKDLSYDAAGERTSMAYTVAWTENYDANGNPGTYYYDDSHTEWYAYTEDGYLSTVTIGDNRLSVASAATFDYTAPTSGTLRAQDTRDSMGRATLHVEKDAAGNQVYSRSAIYNALSLVVQDTQATLLASGSTQTTTTHYDYNALSGSTWTGAYQGGVLTHMHTATSGQADTDTVNSYTWLDTARESAISYNDGQGHTYDSTFYYDAHGHLHAVYIHDGRPRTVNYVTDENQQVMSRKEYSSASSNPEELYYYFNGVQVGDVGNDGPSTTDYATAIAAHKILSSNTSPWANATSTYAGSAVSFADFSQGYQPVGPGTDTATAGSYTVHDGDTLQGIAQTLWGDASLWFMIADANGLDASSELAAGQTLIIPAKVVNLHQSSSTFRVYDPNKAIGDVEPTTQAPPPPPPPAPKKHHGCGVIGQIISTIIAIVVTVVLTPIIGPIGAAAVANVASQGFNIITGAQDKFSWKSLGMAVVTAGVTEGIDASGVFNGLGGGFVQGAATAATASVISQGIGVATGLQDHFDWVGVAAAGVVGGVTSSVHNMVEGALPNGMSAGTAKVITNGVSGMAGGIAGAATRSLLEGSDFGDNLMAVLPSVIGATIGNLIAGQIPKIAPVDPAHENPVERFFHGLDNAVIKAGQAVGNGVRDVEHFAGEIVQGVEQGAAKLVAEAGHLAGEVVHGVENMFSPHIPVPEDALNSNPFSGFAGLNGYGGYRGGIRLAQLAPSMTGTMTDVPTVTLPTELTQSQIDDAAFKSIGLSEVSGSASIADRMTPPGAAGGGWTVGWEQEDFSTNPTQAKATLTKGLVASGYLDEDNAKLAASAFAAAKESASVSFKGIVDAQGDPVDLGTINDALITKAGAASIYDSTYNNYMNKFHALITNISEDDNVLGSVKSAMADRTYGPLLQLVVSDYNNQIGMDLNSEKGMMGLLTTGTANSNFNTITTTMDETSAESVVNSVMTYYLNSQYVASGHGADVTRRLNYDVQTIIQAESASHVPAPNIPISVAATPGTMTISSTPAENLYRGVWTPTK